MSKHLLVVGAAALLLALSGCPTYQVRFRRNDQPAPKPMQPVPIQRVMVLYEKPKVPYTTLGLVTALGEYEVDERLRRKLEEEAARQGCEAIQYVDKKQEMDDDGAALWLPPTQDEPIWAGFAVKQAGYRAVCLQFMGALPGPEAPRPRLEKLPEVMGE